MEARVTDKSRGIAATMAGAAIGGVAGYLFFTERGRELKRQIEPALENFSRELDSFRGTFQKAASVASEGWKLLNEAMEPGPSPHYPTTRQSSPF
jgi:gas vesicle protein